MAHMTEFQNGGLYTRIHRRYSIFYYFDHVLDRKFIIFYLTLIIQPAGKIIIRLLLYYIIIISWSKF